MGGQITLHKSPLTPLIKRGTKSFSPLKNSLEPVVSSTIAQYSAIKEPASGSGLFKGVGGFASGDSKPTAHVHRLFEKLLQDLKG